MQYLWKDLLVDVVADLVDPLLDDGGWDDDEGCADFALDVLCGVKFQQMSIS